MTGLLHRFALRASPLLLAGCGALTAPPPTPPQAYVPPPLAQTFLHASSVPAITYKIRNAYTNSFTTMNIGRTARFVNSDGSFTSLACDDMGEKAGKALVQMITAKDMRDYTRAKSQLNQYNVAQKAIGCPLAEI